MAEEEKQNVEETKPKKEEVVPKKEEAQAEKPKEAPAEKQKEVTAEKPKEVPVEKPKEAAAAPTGRVKASNCTQCNKPLKRGNWYYRNGKFYCNKRCWKKSTEKVA